MKKDLIEILVCPADKGSLELIIGEEKDSGIIQGSLQCSSCSKNYPIVNSIPNFLI